MTSTKILTHPPSAFFNSNCSVFFCAGHGIKCYQCASEKSWDDCFPGNDTTCSNSTGSCLQIEFHGEIPNTGTNRVFQKECTMKSVCNDDICKRYRQGSIVRKCNFKCCESDLCNRNILNSSNGAKVPIVSGFLFLICAFKFSFCWNWRKFSVRLKKSGNTFRKWLLLRVL